MADLLGGTRYQIPYPSLLWPIFFALLFTVLNLRGVRTSARINKTLCAIMGAVILRIFLVHDSLHLPSATVSRSLFSASVLQPRDLYDQPVFHGTSVNFAGANLVLDYLRSPRY